jgi:hypothetical protein
LGGRAFVQALEAHIASNRAPSTWVVRFFILFKERAVRLKLAFLTLIFVVVMAACQQPSTPTPTASTVELSITGLTVPEIDQPTADAIRRNMALFLKSNPYTKFEAGNQLLLYLVSTGEFGQAEITLSNGENYQADVLYAYTLMSSQRVLIAPVLVGMTLPDSRYVYFSEKFSFETEESVTTTSADRETALADAQTRLPRGRIFHLLAYGMATPQELDWEICPSISFYPPEICPVGELVELLFPNQTKTFVLRLADEFSPNWLLAGWVFQEFAPAELVPGAIIDVPLPATTQP